MTVQRNQDLPILDELRAELRERVREQERRAAHSGRRRSRGFARRVTRRSVVILAMLSLVAGVALARLETGSSARHTDPRPLGSAAGATISGYRDEGRLCFLLSVAGRTVADCGGVPGAHDLRVLSARARARRYVFGLTGSKVHTILVRVDGQQQHVPAHPPRHPDAAREAEVPAGLRWFVATVPSTSAPAHLRALDPSGKATGHELLDCSLALQGPACRRAYEKRALTHTR